MGPWEEPELLVWRPEAVASAPPLPVGLEVKLGTLVLLLVLTLICSLVPICVLRRPGASPEASSFRQKVLSLPRPWQPWVHHTHVRSADPSAIQKNFITKWSVDRDQRNPLKLKLRRAPPA